MRPGPGVSRASRAAALALLVLGAATGAQAQGGPSFKSGDVPPGGFLEQDLPLGTGDRIAWRLALEPRSGAASYDIHSHEADGRAVNHEEGTFTGERAGTFVVPRAGTYSWLVQNDLGQATLRATISTERAAPEERAMPGPGALALLGAAALAAMLAAARGAGRKP